MELTVGVIITLGSCLLIIPEPGLSYYGAIISSLLSLICFYFSKNRLNSFDWFIFYLFKGFYILSIIYFGYYLKSPLILPLVIYLYICIKSNSQGQRISLKKYE